MTPADEQPPLFLPGWEVEPCDTAPPPTQARRRTHRRRRMPDAWVSGRPAYNVRIPIDQYPEGAETCESARRP